MIGPEEQKIIDEIEVRMGRLHEEAVLEVAIEALNHLSAERIADLIQAAKTELREHHP